jgi:hypothetical protein
LGKVNVSTCVFHVALIDFNLTHLLW